MELLYHDRDLAVCVKPVGLDAESALPAALREALGGDIYTVHRLDLNVGGVMVYARTKPAAAALSRLIQEGAMVKEYMALVHGAPEARGDWTDLLWKDAKKNKVFVVKRERGGVKKARLEYTRLTAGEASLVRIRLHTGRSHQIRVQFASRGYPLVGDHKYGSRDEATSPMLFSCCITFPWKGREMRFERLPGWEEVAAAPCLYHGSIVPGIQRILASAKLHDSDQQVVYLSASSPYSLLYIWDPARNIQSGKHVTAWIKDGIVYYEEQFPDQLRTFYEGVEGWLYSVAADGSFASVPEREAMYFSTTDAAVCHAEHISNVYQELMKYVARGQMKVIPFSEMPADRVAALYAHMADMLVDKGLIHQSDCETSRFYQRYFPSVWQTACLRAAAREEALP